MRLVFGLILGFGVILAGIAVVLVSDYVSQYQSALVDARANGGGGIAVYVAARDIAYADEISPEDITVVNVPSAAIPAGAFSGDGPLLSAGVRFALKPIPARDVITSALISDAGEDVGLTTRLAAGMRAFTITAEIDSGLSRYLRPGDKVDIYWTGRIDRENGVQEELTKLLEASVELIDTGNQGDSEGSSSFVSRELTVAVRPEQVATLAHGQNTGRLSMSLVGAGDIVLAQDIEVNQQSMLGFEATEVAPQAAPDKCYIRTRRGAEVVPVEVPCRN